MKLSKKKGNPDIPTSSMADIAFLLIVFFMVTSVFSVTRGLEFQLPRQDTSAEQTAEEAVHIFIERSGANCSFTVDGTLMALDDINVYLQPKLARNPNKFVIIDPAPTAPYRCMVDVFDELKQGNVKNISIPTTAEKAAWGSVM
ncbi:MAG: biopolymer transporter ExbD [Acidobacteria bacterium]|nr:biopolymer transporter ExbD [Acidobacteriota bacterium]